MARPTGNNLSAPSQDSVACVTVLDDPWRVLWCIAPYSPRCMTWHIPRATKQNSLPTWCIPWHVPRHNWLRGVCRGDLWQTPWIHSWFGIIHGASHVVFLPRCIPWHVSRDNRFRCVCMGLHGCTPWNGPCFWITHCVYHTVFHRKHHVFYHVPWDVSCIHHGVHHGTCHGILHGK